MSLSLIEKREALNGKPFDRDGAGPVVVDEQEAHAFRGAEPLVAVAHVIVGPQTYEVAGSDAPTGLVGREGGPFPEIIMIVF